MQWRQPSQRYIIGAVGLFIWITILLVIGSHSTLKVPKFVSHASHGKVQDRNVFEDVFNSTLGVSVISTLRLR